MFDPLSQVLWLIVGPFLAIYLTWVMYLAVMALKRARDGGVLTPVALKFGYPILFVGIVFDVVTIFTVVFLDFPREGTLSARLSRYYEPGSSEWRSRTAGWFARNLLNSFDPAGPHID